MTHTFFCMRTGSVFFCFRIIRATPQHLFSHARGVFPCLVAAAASAAVVVAAVVEAVVGENKNDDDEQNPIVVVSEEHVSTSFRTFH